jgi:hypothetical protein
MNTYMYGGFHNGVFIEIEIWSNVLFSILKRSVDKSGQRAKVHTVCGAHIPCFVLKVQVPGVRV